MDPGSAVAVFAPLAAVMAAYSLGKVPVVPTPGAAPAPAPAPAPAAAPAAAPATAASSLGDIPLAEAPAPAAADSAISSQESSQSDDPVDDIVQQAITNAKEEQVKSAANFKANRDAAEAQAERQRTQSYGGKRSKRGRTRRVRGGDLPGEKEMKVLSVKLKKALLELTLGSKTPREPFMKLITVTGDQEVALRLLPIFTTFIDWRAGVLSTRRVFAANEYQKKFAEALFADVRSKFEEINPVFRDRPPIKLSEAELKEIEKRNLDVARMEQLAPGSPNGVPAAVAAPPGAAVVQTTGEPGAGTGLFAAPAAPAAPVAEAAAPAPVPDAAAIQVAESRVREEAAAALAAAMAAATEERTAAVQAAEVRVREEAAAAQATLEARALAAENALGLNKEDVANKAAQLAEALASAEKHKNDAQNAATAAKEQEARAQRAEGQLNATREALQEFSVGHMSTSSRVPSLAESEARTARLEATQRLAEAQAKAARVGAPLAIPVGEPDVVDKIEAPASPATAAAPAAVAASPPAAPGAAERIAKMTEESADRLSAAAAAQRLQTQTTINNQVAATQATLERLQQQQSQGIVAPAPPGSGLANAFETRNSAGQPQPRSKLPPPPPSASLLAAHAALGLPNPPATQSRLLSALPQLTPEEKKNYQSLIPSKVGMRFPLRRTSKKGGRRRKTSKRRQRKPRKSTFRRHRKH